MGDFKRQKNTRSQRTRPYSCSTTTRTTACSSARRWSGPPRRSGDSSVYSAQEDQEDGRRRRWRAQYVRHRQRKKTVVTTTIISGEAHPTGQRTRVTDMNTSLTFEQEILDDLPSSVSANTKASAENGRTS